MHNIFEYYDSASYLAHHGIKGQKWGIRRFQNADGTRTEAGKKRYGISGASEDGRKSWVTEHKKELMIAGGITLAVAGAAVCGGYKLNEVATSSLQQKDLALARSYLQQADVLTKKVDEQFHASLRLASVMRDGENLGDIAAEAARYNMSKAQAASEMYKHYAKRAREQNYDASDRFEEIRHLLGKK